MWESTQATSLWAVLCVTKALLDLFNYRYTCAHIQENSLSHVLNVAMHLDRLNTIIFTWGCTVERNLSAVRCARGPSPDLAMSPHMKVHRTKKPFNCELCYKEYTNKHVYKKTPEDSRFTGKIWSYFLWLLEVAFLKWFIQHLQHNILYLWFILLGETNLR